MSAWPSRVGGRREKQLLSRRWMGVAALAVAALWLARAARAETEVEYLQGPAAPKAAGASEPRRAPFNGYASESARTATRLSAEEKLARDFLRQAAQQARFETEAARLATQRAQAPGILAFAADMLDHHVGANPELLRLLSARGMAPPMLENAQRKALNKLGKLQGTKFDREFAALFGRQRQREEVAQFEKAAPAVADPALRAWIDRQLPALREQHVSAAMLVPVGASSGQRSAVSVKRPPIAQRAAPQAQRVE
jgi:putative membrane protein